MDELARRQKTRHERQRATDEVDLDTTLKGGKWKELHMQVALSRPRPRGPTKSKDTINFNDNNDGEDDDDDD